MIARRRDVSSPSSGTSAWGELVRALPRRGCADDLAKQVVRALRELATRPGMLGKFAVWLVGSSVQKDIAVVSIVSKRVFVSKHG